MPLLTPYQADFSAGELSPKLWGRIDLDQYYSGSSCLLNFCALPYGPITRRSGSEFIEEAGSTGFIRLVPFVYSVSQSVVIEFGVGYARFYYNGGVILDANDDPYTIATDLSLDDIKTMDFAQTGDVIYLATATHAPMRLARFGWTDWRFSTPSMLAPYGELNDWGTNNYPQRVCFFDQRLVLASTPKQPQKIWASRIGSFHDFTSKTVITVGSTTDTEVMDTDAIIYSISSDDVNPIAWMLPLEILAIGTEGAEYKAAASTLNEALTPANCRVVKQTSIGSADIKAVSLGTGALFVQRGNTRVRLYDYDYYTNQWNAINATVFADHIGKNKIIDIRAMTSPDTYAWALLEDGTLACFTYEKQQKVNAWHRHKLGGNAFVTAICAIPCKDGDELYMAVKREIDGQVVQYIERLAPAFHSVYDDEGNNYYLDSWVEYEGPEAQIFSGLDHLEGQIIRPWVDGWVHPDVLVENGSVILQTTGEHVIFGLPYKSRFVSMEIQSQEQLTVGNKRNLFQLDVSLYNSLGLRAGVIPDTITDLDNYEGMVEEVYMGPTPIMNKATAPFTGVRRIDLRGNYESGQRVCLETDYPLPMTIRGIKYYMNIS